MGVQTAERVSREITDNYVYQRSRLAYVEAAKIVSGRVLEIGTGTGYGIDIIAPCCESFVTLDKFASEATTKLPSNVEFKEATVPPLPFADESFDYVVSFQVIEHIDDDKEFVREIHRVLRKGGKFIVTTPNRPMSLTRNPWHIREYTEQQLRDLLAADFSSIEAYGVNGNEKIMQYYEQNRRSVERIMRFDILDLQHRLPRWILQIPYDVMNRINRRRLLENNNELTRSIKMDDYSIGEISPQSFDLYYIATK